MKNRGSTLILKNLVGVHQRNIPTKLGSKSMQRIQRFERSRKSKKGHNNDNKNNNNNGHYGDRYSCSHSLSVTYKMIRAISMEFGKICRGIHERFLPKF